MKQAFWVYDLYFSILGKKDIYANSNIQKNEFIWAEKTSTKYFLPILLLFKGIFESFLFDFGYGDREKVYFCPK